MAHNHLFFQGTSTTIELNLGKHFKRFDSHLPQKQTACKHFKTGLLWGQKVLTYRNRPVCLRVRVLLVYSDTAAVSLSRQSHQAPLIKTGVLPQRTQKLLVCRCASHRYTTTSRRESGTNINRRGFKVLFSLNLDSFSDFSLLENVDCFEGKHQHHLLKVGAFTSDRLKKGSVQI